MPDRPASARASKRETPDASATAADRSAREGARSAAERAQTRPEPDGDTSLLRATRKMADLMSPRERRRLLMLIPAVTLMALFQVVGIASIMPFLALVADPQSIQDNRLLAWLYTTLSFDGERAFLLFVGSSALVLLVASNAFTAFTEWVNLRYSWSLNHTLSVRILRQYLTKPYVFFLNENTASLAKNILSEVKQVVKGFVVAGIDLISKGIVALFILALLIAVNPLLALLAFLFLGVAYLGIFALVRKRMSENGKRRSENDRERYKAANEALSGVKDIKILGREGSFIKRFSRPSMRYSRYMANQAVIALVPRYAFETIAFGGLLLLVIWMLAQGQGLEGILPVLGVYAFASYRLLPALQKIFAAVTSLRFSVPAVDVLHQDLERTDPPQLVDRSELEPLPFRERLELRDLTFRYPGAPRPVLDDFELVIEPNTSVALVGTTGSGKTTSVDLLLGLLAPERGQLRVDGVPVDRDNLARWQMNLGYVPQQIYLSDDSVARNIAFGINGRHVDRAQVERAARLANIHDFITTELPQGYDTMVGERGVRLSGGQRQRLGIARALYHDPAMLVFDEATSALDGVTEEHIFGAVDEIGKSKTIVMIAHRLATVRNCDVIYLLEHGRIVAQGTYDELIRSSPKFRALAQVDGNETAAAPV